MQRKLLFGASFALLVCACSTFTPTPSFIRHHISAPAIGSALAAGQHLCTTLKAPSKAQRKSRRLSIALRAGKEGGEGLNLSKEGFDEAVKGMGEVANKFNAYTQCKDPQEAAVIRRDLVESYTKFAVPAASFSIVSLSLFASTFALIYTFLGLSGRGYDDVIGLVSGIDFLKGLLEAVPSKYGNLGITLVLLEVCAPILAASTLALAPKAADALQSKLPEWGLDADGLNRRMDAIVEARSRGKE